MTKKLYSESNFGDIADAIRDKGGEGEYTVAEMGDAIRDLNTGGGDVLNGIIEQYKAKTGTISADTFVEFVNGDLSDGFTQGVDTSISDPSGGLQSGYPSFSATSLDTSRVFVAYLSSPISSSSSSKYLYGVVCDIDSNGSITRGDTVLLRPGAVSPNFSHVVASLCSIDTVFVAHEVNKILCGIVCTISGSSVTVGTETQIVTMHTQSTSSNYVRYSAVAFDEGKVFIAHRYDDDSTSYMLYGVVCVIVNTTITVGDDTAIAGVADAIDFSSAVAVTLDKVFIAHRNGSYLYGVVCTISGTTITVGTDTQLSSLSSSYIQTSVGFLGPGKMFVAHGVSSRYLYGVVCTISGTTITVGTDTQLSSTDGANTCLTVSTLATAKVLVTHSSRDAKLYGAICTVSGTAITVNTDALLAASVQGGIVSTAVLLSFDRAFVLRVGEKNFLYGISLLIPDQSTITPMEDARVSGGAGGNAADESSAVAIGENKVFVAHRGAGTSYLYGVVCTIAGSDITAGADTVISSLGTSSSYESTSVVSIATDKVFVTHGVYSSSRYLYGVVCTVSGTTITVGTDTQLSSTASSYKAPSNAIAVCSSEETAVFYRNYSDTYLYGVVCTVSGTTITVGTQNQILDTEGTNRKYTIAVANLDSDKIFVARVIQTTLYGVVCTINGETITAGANTQITSASSGSGSYASDVAALALNSATVCLFYGNMSLSGVVCTISETTISAGTAQRLNSQNQNNSLSISAVLCDNATGTVFVAHQRATQFYGIVCGVDGGTITAGTDVLLSDVSDSYQYASATPLNTGTVFVSHQGTNTDVAAFIVSGNVVVQPSATKIEGLTAGECTTSTAGDVWVLDTDVSS